MARHIVRTQGFRELEQALLELPKATGRNTARRALLKAAQPIADDASANAPIGETGKLSSTIEPGTRLSRRQSQLHKKQSPFEVFIGPSADPRGVQQEFGNANHPAQPFMRPAWEANKARALSTIRTELKNEIHKSAQRIARKAARLAAKTGT